jgi:hypothetical protein
MWIYITAMLSAISMLMYMEPGILEKSLSGEIWFGLDPAPWLLFMALLWMIPQAMSVANLFLSGQANRKANITVGLAYFILIIGSFVEHLAVHIVEAGLSQPYFYNLMMIASIILVAGAIAYLSYSRRQFT